jgi:hypothetical protein
MDTLTREEAAARLGIDRKTLYRRMKAAGMPLRERLTLAHLGHLGQAVLPAAPESGAPAPTVPQTVQEQEGKQEPPPLVEDRLQRLEDRVAALEALLRFSPFLPKR